MNKQYLSILEAFGILKEKQSVYVDDSLLKGGYRVVNTIQERDEIDCCHRKWGMVVRVVGPDLDFKEYVLKSRKCRDNEWEEVKANVDVDVPTNTSQLINDGEDGINPFITALDISDPIPQVNSDWNATTGVEEILNKPTNLSDFNNDEGFITLADIPEVDLSTKANIDGSNITDVITWREALDIYSKLEVDNKFIDGYQESLTSINQPVLVGNILTIKYIGENGIEQQQNVDLSNLATIDIHITDATYNASTNILSLIDNDGTVFQVDLSEFSIITSTDANGVTTLTQEGVTKLIVSKVGQSGSYNDLLDKPTIPAPVDISNKEDKANKQNNLTTDGTGIKYPTVDAVNGGLVSKLNNPTTDGSWVVTKSGSTITYTDASTFGQNISNANLSNTSARIFTQGNAFTWNTAGFGYYLKGLVDRTGNGTYSKVVVVHPTTGEMVTRDFADPQATTLAVQNANIAQKTAMRTALLGAGVPPSPVINVVNTYFIKKEVYTSLFLNGINLTPLDPVSIWIENGATKVYAENYYAISGTVLQTFWNIPASFPNGEYSVKIANGAVTQGASPGKIYVTDTFTEFNINTSNTKLLVRDGYSLLSNTSAVFDNILRIFKYSTSYPTTNNSTIDVAIKTFNFSTPGSSWEIQIDFSWIVASYTGESSIINPLVLLTETSDANFTSVESIVHNYKLIESGSRLILSAINTGFVYGVASNFSFNIKKTGNIINIYRINTSTGAIDLFQTLNIDDSKNYALAFFGTRNTAPDTHAHRMQFNFTKFYFKP